MINMASKLIEHKSISEQLYIRDELTVKEILEYMNSHHELDLKDLFYLSILCLSWLADSAQ